MNQHQRVAAALRNHVRGNDGFAEGRGGCQNTCIVLKKRLSSLALFRPQLATELNVNWRAELTFISQRCLDAKPAEFIANVVEAPPRQRHLFREKLRAGDDTRLAEGR